MNIPVIDRWRAAEDPEMRSISLALNPREVQRRFKRRLVRLSGEQGLVYVKAIRVTRYKPGRRCMVEYTVEVERPKQPPEAVALLGKIRARRFGQSGYRLLNAFWDAGFRSDSFDSIAVPEPIITISAFKMWLQRKVEGRPGTDLLGTPGTGWLARRIAEAAHKIHQARVPTERRHTMADELGILRTRLSTVAQAEPRWAERLDAVLAASDRLGATTPAPIPCGIHRDFYPDQVIVDDSHLSIIDFDLYCEGDPGLDIGNFLGHITEQSLRTLGDPRALADMEQELEERFVELAGEATRAAIRAYATLTLVRHISLSTQFPERRAFTAPLLELCEERLEVRNHARA